MQKRTKIILIVILLLILGGLMYWQFYQEETSPNRFIGNNSLGTVEKHIYGNASAENSIVIITGMHPRERLAINPEIKAAKDYASNRSDLNIIHYQVNVTKDPKIYKNGRANGESLVHDFVVPDIANTNAKAVIISHSHIEDYGEGFYLATPAMDNASVDIAYKINNTTDFNYYPRTGNESYKSTSATLVSKPIADLGYPTFVYEVPENITAKDSRSKTMELFDLLFKYA